MSKPITSPATSPTVEAILEWNRGRDPDRLRLKFERMGRDVFAFFRGTDHLFGSAWPGLEPVDPGPDLLICGDLHLENFGGYRTGRGTFAFDVNDFDEALVAPGSLDLVRCSTSILLAGEVWGLSPIRALRTVLGYLDRYRATVLEHAGGRRGGAAAEPGDLGSIERRLGDSALATRGQRLGRFTRVDRATGLRVLRRAGGRLPALGPEARATVVDAVEAYGRALGEPDPFRVLDASARVAGIGSLGVDRYVALVEGDGSPEGNRLLDLKAAGPPSLLGCARGPQPSSWTSEAARVVDAQRRLQAEPTAGLDVIAVEGRDFRLRELIPDENQAAIDSFRRKPARLRRAVELSGRLTARMQLRAAGADRADELARWAASPSLDAVLAAAVRFAERTREDYRAFRKAKLDRPD